jgi:biotin-(acetyl-CoA carboxylase) ligase
VELQPLLKVLVGTIIAHMHLLQTESSSILARWQEHDYLYKQPVMYTTGTNTLFGTGQGITEHGLYRFIDTSGSEHTIVGGQLRPWDGALPNPESTANSEQL